MPRDKFLIIKLSSMGDVLHTLPALRSLRRAYPRAHIAWAVEEKSRDILDGNPDVDEVVILRTRRWRKQWSAKHLGEFTGVLGALRRQRFDVALDFQGLMKSAALARLSGARECIGFHSADCREKPAAWLMHRRLAPVAPRTHVVEKNLALLTLVGVTDFTREFPLAIPREAEDYVDKYLESQPGLAGRPVVGVNPGVGFKSKRWDLKKFSRLADRIGEELGCRILLTWGPGEEELVRAIASGMRQAGILAPPTTIHQSAALLRRLALFVSCDTGPMHLCAALGVPTVSIFGPTDPARNGPYGANHRVVCKPQPCSFCYKRRCPTGNECMAEVGVDRVFDAVRDQLAAHHKKILTT